MTDHKPECPMLDEQWPKHPLEICEYCDRLRACEQRVRDEERGWEGAVVVARAGYEDGYAAALDAAREAVAAVPHGISVGTGLHIHRERALAAIKALREEKSDD